MKRILFTLAIASAALCACNKAESPMVPDTSNPVRFTVANLGSYAFKSPTVAIGEEGCGTVGIYAVDLGVTEPVQATVSGTALNPATTIYWGVGQTEASTFVARYPYAAAALSGSYDIPADQSNVDTYSYHSNLMTAVTSATPDPGTVAFDFCHPFAKIVVNVTNNLGADEVASVVMKKMKLNATTFNIATMPVTITAAEDLFDVTAYKAADNKYEMVVLPQAATEDMDIVVATAKGSVYTFRITNASYNFLAGKTATADVTLNPVDGSGGARAAVGAISFETSNWTDGDATTIGTVSTVVNNYWTISGTVYSTADKDDKPDAWGKKYNMVYTAENTWSLALNYDDSMAGDESGKGFKFILGDTYYGAATEETPETGATLASPGNNIKLASAGKYTITFNESTHVITYTRTGDAE